MAAPKRWSPKVGYTVKPGEGGYDPKKAKAEARARKDAANAQKEQEAAHKRLLAKQREQQEALRKKGRK
jgi:hypothetical protein